MFIVFNEKWKVGEQDILPLIAQHKKEPVYLISHTDFGGSRIIPGNSELKRLKLESVYEDLSDDPKFFIQYYGKVGHTILQTIIPVCWIVKSIPSIKLVINISEYLEIKKHGIDHNLIEEQSFNYANTYYELLFKILDFYNVSYELIDCNYNFKQAIKLSNFYTFTNGPIRSSMLESFDQVIDEIYPELSNILPTRKVYLSRQKTWIPDFNNTPENTKHEDEDPYYFRVLKERDLEKFLIDNGYEILYPENFKTIKDQIAFMRSVKELISATSSGLNNMLFMHPEQTIIELYSALPLGNLKNQEYHLHDHYHAIGYYKKMFYLSLALTSKSSEWIINKIINDKFLKGVIND
jgi:hypothetical protein